MKAFNTVLLILVLLAAVSRVYFYYLTPTHETWVEMMLACIFAFLIVSDIRRDPT